ncbi:MAG: hypothetical protein AB9891_06710 [Anaerolineaceae bacterium]
MRNIVRSLIGILLVTAFALSACGGGAAPAGPEAPAVTEAPAPVETAVEAVPPASTEAPVAEAPPVDKTAPMLHISMVKGKVEVREQGGQFSPAQVGQKLAVGTEIRTGADGIAALYRDTLSLAVLDQNSVLLVKKLAFKAGQPITILALIRGAAAVDYKGKLPDGAVFAIETPNKQLSGVLGSTVRVSFNTETKTMTATCISGDCNFVKSGQTLSLKEGQQVDVQGMIPLPGMPNVMEISTDQANGFLAQAHAMCGCNLPISEIRDAGLGSFAPPPSDVPTPEEDLKNSADENGNTDPANDEMTGEQLDQITEDVMGEPSPDSGEEPAPDSGEEPAPDGGEEPASEGGGEE